MRVRCREENCTLEVEYAKCEDKRLIFMASNGAFFHTDDYYHENIASCALTDLTINGYIVVDKLHLGKGE